jgi:hypothetical protein
MTRSDIGVWQIITTARGIGVSQAGTMTSNINPGIRCEGLQSMPFRDWEDNHEEPRFRRSEVGPWVRLSAGGAAAKQLAWRSPILLRCQISEY